MNVAITGVAGFIGSNLQKYLKAQNIHVIPIQSDITSFAEVSHEIKALEFDAFIHLAGISNVTACEKDPQLAFNVNTLGTLSILESLLKLNKKTKFIFTSTAQVYNPSILDVKNKITIDENFDVAPKNTYARSKLSAELLIKEYFTKYPLGEAIVLRLFNHTHESHRGDFVIPYVLTQLEDAISSHNTEANIPIGNIDLFRDFSLIQDLLKLFDTLLNSNAVSSFETYNICSGQGRSVRELLNLTAEKKGIKAHFISDPSRIRKNDPEYLVGSNQKIARDFNWHPTDNSDKQFIEKFFEKL